jgi:cytochrome oxidase Cu insertion factor (SCO1/SenC/PrrC family)
MLQLTGGIALAGMAGCLGLGDDDEEAEESDGDVEEEEYEGYEESSGGDRAKTGDDAPDFDLETPDGEKVELKPVEKPTVVMFADVTNDAAKSHSKTLVDFEEKHGDHARVVTINSNLDASKDDVRTFQTAYGGDWECAMGTHEVIEKYDVDAAVALFVVDERGKLVARLEAEATAAALGMFLDAYADV